MISLQLSKFFIATWSGRVQKLQGNLGEPRRAVQLAEHRHKNRRVFEHPNQKDRVISGIPRVLEVKGVDLTA